MTDALNATRAAVEEGIIPGKFLIISFESGIGCSGHQKKLDSLSSEHQ